MHGAGVIGSANGAAGSVLEPPPRSGGPEEVADALVASLSGGRLRGATACFSRDACLITPDSTAVHGRDDIRRLLAQLIAREVRIEVLLRTELRAGEVVLSRQRWLVHSQGADGSGYTQDLNATLVLREVEESWKVAIAAPWG